MGFDHSQINRSCFAFRFCLGVSNLKSVIVLLPSLKEAGPAIVAATIAEVVRKKGLESVFLSLRINEPKKKKWLEEKGFKIIEIGMRKIPIAKDQKELERVINERGASLVHSHGFWPIVMLSKVRSNVAKVTTMHEEPVKLLTLTYGKTIARAMCATEGKALEAYSAVVACSESVSKALEEDILAPRRMNLQFLKIIPNGVFDIFPNGYLEGKTQVHPNQGEAIRIISASTLTKRKNLETAIRAVAFAVDHGANLSYCIYGSGPEEKRLRKLISQKKLNSQIKLQGFVRRERLLKVMSSDSNLVMMPSFSEGLSLAALEAMMIGRPLLCSNIPSFKHVVIDGFNGFLCEPEDYECFGNALVALGQDTEKITTMGNNSRSLYEEKFTGETMGESYYNLYQGLIANNVVD